MVISREKCNICGTVNEFVIDDNATLFREAKCQNCGASIRNSDTALSILKFINSRAESLSELTEKDVEGKLILNTCSSGSIHDALKHFPGYICSEYFKDVPSGEYYEGILSVDLSNIPFPDNSIDLIISEDVFEHVEDYDSAMKEIFRVLKPGGEHIFTVPIHDGKKTVSRKGKKDVYHGDPNPKSGDGGVIVFTDWGEDIADIISSYGFETSLVKNHAFFTQDEVTDVDSDYDEYLKHVSDLIRYFKYNSFVIESRKPVGQGVITTMPDAWYQNLRLNKVILAKNEEIRKIGDDNRNRGDHIVKLDKEIDYNRAYISSLQSEVAKEKDNNKLLMDQIEKRDSENSSLRNQIEERNDEIADLKQAVLNKQGHIELLLEVERAYERDKKTRSYRFAKWFSNIPYFFFPPGSKRRFFGRVIKRCIRHPGFILKTLNPGRISRYFKALKEGGMDEVNHHFDLIVETDDHDNIDASNLELAPVSDNGESKSIEEYEKLTIKEWENPEVSIVIPVYNQFDYTYNCIKSIKKQSVDMTYEIIIGDDCSTDLTERINEVVSGIKVIRNENNLRFLLNCNNAAKHAKGKFILFLNNDTQVQENWLRPLVDVMKDESVGMVGSKLVYADGRLQEAGGILWKDGSAWNYGNKMNPDDTEYNYVKEVDYISGAAIMIRKTLWEEIGGFDERFVPAYCEDSDLAFEVRKHGYKVLYQPLSVVVHFEGVSNGTDLSSGQKQYQVINQKKFYEKWKDVLEKDHFPNAENVFMARDRSKDKPVLLMVDHYTPQFDKDAGSRTVYAYLKLFLAKGFNVKFIGDNFYMDPIYTTAIEQLGVEVLYGYYYSQHWQDWIKDNGQYIGYVFLNRPHISVKYIDFIRENTKAKIMYYGHDLHFLREYREYELNGDKEKLKSSEEWKTKELDLINKADVVYYPSQIEIDEVKKIAPKADAKAIVAYMYDDVRERVYDYDARKDIMFIGGFGHPPNEDGIMWFLKEVFPKVQKAIPDLNFYVMGSNPTDNVKAMESDHIKILGFVTDEELAERYNSCRISVVPLRVGAGIKGKVIEAMRFGIPVVTTTIGAEGILGAEDILCVEDDPDKMAKRLIALYNDENDLKNKSSRSYKYILDNYSSEGAWKVIEKDFN